MSRNRTNHLATALGGSLAAMGIRAWMSTLDYRAVYYDPDVDPAKSAGERRIYIFWHENILFPLYLRGGCNLAMLLSRHRDADILAEVAGRFGFSCVRGSTFRGAVPAIRDLLRRGRQMHLAITPDGPRGPRRQLAQGAIYLASKLGMPLVALGFGYDRPWRTPTWDRFAIPRPFSRARAIVGPALHIPPNLDRNGVETCRARVESLLTDLTDQADEWAASGRRQSQEVNVRRQRPNASLSKRLSR
jgi:lysophospholipid acyltransferase (LPLAT)-like uncharacterized protein